MLTIGKCLAIILASANVFELLSILLLALLFLLALRLQNARKENRLYFRSHPNPMWVIDVQTGSFLAVNDAAIRYYGYNREEFLAMTIKDIHPADELTKLEQFLQRQGIEPDSGTWKHIKKNGELLDVAVCANRISFKGRRACQVVATGLPRSSKQQSSIAEPNLYPVHEQLRLFESIIHNLQECVIITEPEPVAPTDWRRVLYVNQAFSRMTGYAASEIIGNTAQHLLGKNPDEEIIKKLISAIEQKQAVKDLVIQQFTKDRKAYWAELSIFPIIDASDTLSGWYLIQRDITEKKQAEILIQQSREQIENILESITDGFVSLNTTGEYTYVNEKAAQMLKRDRKALLGKNIWTEFPELVEHSFYKQYHEAAEKKQSDVVEVYLPDLQRWYQSHFYPAATGMTGFIRDITENKFLENKLRLSEEKYRLLFKKNPIPLWMCEPDTLAFIEVNQAAIRKYLFSYQEFISLTLHDICHPEDLPDVLQKLKKIKQGTYSRIHMRHRQKDGKVLHSILIATLINYQGKNVILATSNDITELKKAKLRVINSFLEGEEQERKRIASELHDGLGQNLTAAMFNFTTIKESLAMLDHKKYEQFMTGLCFLNSAIEEARSIASNLIPKTIEDFGLQSSLHSLVSNIHKTSSVEIFFYTNLEDERFNSSIELNVYRITQELLQNTLKHAQATKISLQLIRHSTEMIFTYEDNGKGFTKQNITSQNKGLGIRNIHYRVTVLEGQLQIDSQPGQGMSVTIVIPVHTNGKKLSEQIQ